MKTDVLNHNIMLHI